MAVLNTTSPTDRPGAPTEAPSNTVPSSRTRIAVWVTGFAYVRLQKTAGAGGNRSGSGGIRRAGMIPGRPGKGKPETPVQAPGGPLSLLRTVRFVRGDHERQDRVCENAGRPAGNRGAQGRPRHPPATAADPGRRPSDCLGAVRGVGVSRRHGAARRPARAVPGG